MYLKVEVTPDAKREKFEELPRTKFKIAVREPALQNRANERARALLALHFKIPVGKVKIVAGFRSPHKIFSVPDKVS